MLVLLYVFVGITLGVCCLLNAIYNVKVTKVQQRGFKQKKIVYWGSSFGNLSTFLLKFQQFDVFLCVGG
jgi:uncharacterized SAM-dependent methyltransferase